MDRKNIYHGRDSDKYIVLITNSIIARIMRINDVNPLYSNGLFRTGIKNIKILIYGIYDWCDYELLIYTDGKYDARDENNPDETINENEFININTPIPNMLYLVKSPFVLHNDCAHKQIDKWLTEHNIKLVVFYYDNFELYGENKLNSMSLFLYLSETDRYDIVVLSKSPEDILKQNADIINGFANKSKKICVRYGIDINDDEDTDRIFLENTYTYKSSFMYNLEQCIIHSCPDFDQINDNCYSIQLMRDNFVNGYVIKNIVDFNVKWDIFTNDERYKSRDKKHDYADYCVRFVVIDDDTNDEHKKFAICLKQDVITYIIILASHATVSDDKLIVHRNKNNASFLH